MTEHELFARLTDTLARASADAAQMAAIRGDNRWQAVADLLTQVKDNVFALAMQGTRQ